MIFIIGMPRSGTKLLRELLNRHSMISIPGIETEFFPLLKKAVTAGGDLSEYPKFAELYKKLKVLPFFVYLEEDGTPVDSRSWYEACEEYSAECLFSSLLRLVTGTQGCENVIIGDKSPSYINQLDLLLTSFPQASFVHIVRDSRDYCLSINKAWGKSMTRAASRWAISVQNLISKKTEMKLYEIRYEDLLLETDRQLENLCLFLGVPYEPSMAEISKSVENIGDAKNTKGILSENVNKYKDAENQKKIREVEKITCRELRHYGYPVTWEGDPKSLSGITNFFLQIHDALSLIFYERKHRGVIGSAIFYLNYFRATRAL